MTECNYFFFSHSLVKQLLRICDKNVHYISMHSLREEYPSERITLESTYLLICSSCDRKNTDFASTENIRQKHKIQT